MPEVNEKPNNQIVPHKGGVKTLEGKAVSKYNAQRHSILRETLTDYEQADAGQVYDDLLEDLQPNGRFQELLVEMITSNIIRLQRIAKAEGELVKESSAGGGLEISFKSYDAQLKPNDAEKLLIYSRYQTATENRIYRALLVLKQLKANGQS